MRSRRGDTGGAILKKALFRCFTTFVSLYLDWENRMNIHKINNEKNRRYSLVLAVAAFAVVITCACGKQELSFGEDRFYSIRETQAEDYLSQREYPVQIAVGDGHVWILTSVGAGNVYDRNLEEETVQNREWQQGENEMLMALSAQGNQLYACVSDQAAVQIRKLSGESRWETVTTIGFEDAPESIRPTAFFVDQSENGYFVKGDEVWRYSAGEGQKTVYEMKAPVVFFQEKEPGVVQAVVNDHREIALYTLEEGGGKKKNWTIELPSTQVVEIKTDDVSVLCLAVDDRILFIDNGTGKIQGQFDCISAGVSTELFGGLCMLSHGILYLEERTADRGGLWQKLAQQGDVQGDRTLLVYGTADLSAAMKERIVSFNKSNPDYYVSVQEYGGGDVNAGKLQLQAALASGHGPDIVDLYMIDNYIACAKKGYLEDLEPWLLQQDFSDDILWQIQNLYQVDGKLCMLVPHFMIQGLAIHPEYAKYVDDWNFENFVKLVELNDKDKHIAGSTSESILSMLLEGMQGEFLDWEGKKAYFDTPEFVSLLELCKEQGRESFMVSGVSYDYEDVVDKFLLSWHSMTDPMDCEELYAYFGEDAVPYGFPTATGQVFLVDKNRDACGIYSGSKNKEGAGEFLRTLFDTDYQEWMSGGIGISWGIRESCWYAMWDHYRSSDFLQFGSRRVDPPSDEDVEMFAEALLMGNLSADLVSYDITELVMEEARAYFAGDCSVEEAVEKIQNRVGVLLAE